MFGVDSGELFLIALVAIAVIGPKDLPRVMRTVGKWVGRARGMANQFRSGMDQMVRETELAEMEKKWREENERIMREFPMTAEATTAADPATSPDATAADGKPAPAMVKLGKGDGSVPPSASEPDWGRPVKPAAPTGLPKPPPIAARARPSPALPREAATPAPAAPAAPAPAAPAPATGVPSQPDLLSAMEPTPALANAPSQAAPPRPARRRATGTAAPRRRPGTPGAAE